MKESLMYRLCYYRFGEVRTRGDQPAGFDTVRNSEIGLKKYDLHYFREAYTSSRWLVRIYEVLPLPNRGPEFPGAKPTRGTSTTSTLKVLKKPKI
jgi:dolichyl-diphosphooligosaccharide--protein glycosyltransferase